MFNCSLHALIVGMNVMVIWGLLIIYLNDCTVCIFNYLKNWMHKFEFMLHAVKIVKTGSNIYMQAVLKLLQ